MEDVRGSLETYTAWYGGADTPGHSLCGDPPAEHVRNALGVRPRNPTLHGTAFADGHLRARGHLGARASGIHH